MDELETSVLSLNQTSLETVAINLLADVFIGGSLGKVAMVSSFGAESAVLLHLISRVDRDAPVFFVDTGKLFPETLAYQRGLTKELGLQNVETISATTAELEKMDADGELHRSDLDACCNLRKVVPLERALVGYDAWITGRKRHQSTRRANLQVFEADQQSGRIKLNPLVFWEPRNLIAYAVKYDLPRHPLVAKGYPSIGCLPCTSRVQVGENTRSGRWRGVEKTECGIHDRLPTLSEEN